MLKTAQRIIIDLKDKVAKGMPTSDLLFDTMDNTIKQEALSALLALGFAKKGAESKIQKVLKSNPETISSYLDKSKLAIQKNTWQIRAQKMYKKFQTTI